MNELSTTRIDIANQSIITSLDYEYRTVRHRQIHEAHHQTFGWVFHDDYSGLLKWLKEGTGIFWVSGKPGSGKSTFMKFVADDDRTRQALNEWASPKAVTIASHYFCHVGTPMQKSQDGLLQHLLLGILREHPDLARHVCPRRWEDAGPLGTALYSWSVPELRRALELVATLAVDEPICVFIDGLDEYDVDYLDLCQTLCHLASSERIKICVSSRPWNIFQMMFGHNPGLRIHDLTKGDIEKYVRSRLTAHPHWCHLDDQPSSGNQLIGIVAGKAQGVFLWVFLVTNLLREGLTARDDFLALVQKLGSFPSDLTLFFKKMLSSVKTTHDDQKKMSAKLRMALVAQAPLHYALYDYHDREYDDIDYALKLKSSDRLASDTENPQLRQKVILRLNNQCKGLLEMRDGDDRVHFLHKTVSDFLQTRKMNDYLIEKGVPGFNPLLSILKASIASIKDTCKDDIAPGSLSVLECFTWAYRLEKFPGLGETVGDLLDNLEAATCQAFSRKSSSSDPAHLRDAMESTNCRAFWNDPPGNCLRVSRAHLDATTLFRRHVIQHHLAGYLERSLDQNRYYLINFEHPPFPNLNCPLIQAEREESFVKTLEVLLRHRHNPNYLIQADCQSQANPNLIDGESFHKPNTFWSNTMLEFRKKGTCGFALARRYAVSAEICKALMLLLQFGADPNAKIYSQCPEHTFLSVAWVEVVRLSFDLEPHHDTYLDVLDTMFNADLDMDVRIPIAGLDTTDLAHRWFHYSLQRASMRDSNGFAAVDAPLKHRLLQAVTERLLKKAQGHNWPMDEIWPVVEEAFGERQQQAMQRRVEESHSGEGPVAGSTNSGSKRPRLHESDGIHSDRAGQKKHRGGVASVMLRSIR